MKNVFLDIVEVSGDVVEAWKTGTQEHFEHVIEKVCGRVAEMKTSLTLAIREAFEKSIDLVDIAPMPSDEMGIGQNDIKLAWIRCPVSDIKEGNVYREEETIVVVDCFRLIGGGTELLDGNRMNIEVLLKISDVFFCRISKIDPSGVIESNRAHIFYF